MNHFKGAVALALSGGLVAGAAVDVRANPVAVPAVAACVASTERFHLVICTWDGSVPAREFWHDGNAPLLVIRALPDGQLATHEDGSGYYELVEREEWLSPFEDWEIQGLQHFEPVAERLPGDYDRVVVAWSVRATRLDESTSHEAA